MFDFKKNHILQALLLIAIVWLVIKLSSVVLLFFIAFLFILILHPVVRRLKAWHFPTALAVLTPVLALVGLAVLVGFFIVPAFIDQAKEFSKQVPTYLNDLQRSPIFHNSAFHVDTKSVTKFIQDHADMLSTTLLTITTTVITLAVGVITIIVVTLYGVGNYDRLRLTFLSYVPVAHRDRAYDILARIEKKVVMWLGAQLLLSVVVGVMVWIGAALLGLPFPGILGLISGVLEVIPTLGPIAATVPSFLLGLTISLRVAVFAIVLHLIVQQIENHVLAPLLLGRTVNLHPIVIIFSLLVGALLYGILGTLLAVPAALVISAIVDSFRDGKPQRKLKAPLAPEDSS